MLPTSVFHYIKDAAQCICAVALRVTVMDGCEPLDWSAIGGGGGSTTASGDLETVCDADGNPIFVKVVTDEDGNCCYINPVDGEPMTPMVDFFPCPLEDNSELIVCIKELKECICAPCPPGVLDKWLN